MPPETDGEWSGPFTAPGDSHQAGDGLGVFGIHAVLLRTGKVLMFSGHAEDVHYLAEAWVWDPDQPAGAQRVAFPSGTDIFCCHQATLDDGRVITVGGAAPSHGSGIKAICVFDPVNPGWEEIGELTEARWYPTIVTRPDGSLVAFSGRDHTGGAIASTAELLAPPFVGPGYTTTTLAGGTKTFPTYPSLHLVPGGAIVHTGATWRYEYGAVAPIGTFSFHVTSPSTAVWHDEGTSPDVDLREEGIAVLLPPAQDGRILLIGGGHWTGGAQAAAAQPRSAEVLDTQATPMTWTRVADMTHPRINVNAVLLPDGKVWVHGGHDKNKWEASSTTSKQVELFDPVLNTWTAAASSVEPRTYHSIALLLPDGKVVTAGGVDPTRTEPGHGGALNQKTFELYRPPYFFNGPRPTITAVTRDDGPADTLVYGGQFVIETPQAADVARVALMRPGAITHHTDTEQRYVALDWVPDGAGRVRASVPNDASVAPPGWYMLWIVDGQQRPCERARFVQLGARRCFVVMDRSHVSKDEVADPANPATEFPNAFYVVMDGFLPSELGITGPSPSPAQLAAEAPTIAFDGGAGGAGAIGWLHGVPEARLDEDPTLPPGVRQRFTYRYRLDVDGTAGFFNPDTTPIELQTVDVRATAAGYSGHGELTLSHQPRPYLLDGPTSWLSVDLRVFQQPANQVRFGRNVGGDQVTARAFLHDVLDDFNANPTSGRTQFESIDPDPTESKLELAHVGPSGQRAFNFAIAQVRYRGRTLSADEVRVFFRLFTTAATGFDYRSATTYRTVLNTAGDPVPVLGLTGGEIATIPCFAAERVNTALVAMAEQTDPDNVRTIGATGGTETTAYFGCFLDINQLENRFPEHPSGLGPYTSGLKSIQQLLRGRHQCLVAEVNFDGQVIAEGRSPGGDDWLSQRNLVVVESDNPGGPASHTVTHTFTVKPSRSPVAPVTATSVAAADVQTDRLRTPSAAVGLLPTDGPDELMIRWGNLPHDTEVELFCPAVGSEAVLALAARRIGPHRLERIDDDTVRCLVGDVTYVPIPSGRIQDIPALLTMRLPAGVKGGQEFRVEVAQVSGTPQAIIGTFEVVIAVRADELLVRDEARNLSVLRYIGASLAPDDEWRPVFDRMLDVTAEKIRDLGVDPSDIAGSPLGDGRPWRGEASDPTKGPDGPGREEPCEPEGPPGCLAPLVRWLRRLADALSRRGRPGSSRSRAAT